MGNIGIKGRRWLVTSHIVVTSAHLGAFVCLLLLVLLHNSDGVKAINNYIGIPTGIGSMLTGLLLCWLTHWGFFKYYWVLVKLVLTVAAMVLGIRLLGPWISEIYQLSGQVHLGVLNNVQYLSTRNLVILLSSQSLAFIYLVAISVFKPWGKTFKQARA